MADKLDSILDDLLERWHHFKSGYQLAKGYGSSDATCRDFSTPTHWDWQNGAMDKHEEKVRMQGVDRALTRVPNTPEPWNTVLQFEARNLASAAMVWTSPRLPKGEELEILRMEARTRAILELQREGCMSR